MGAGYVEGGTHDHYRYGATTPFAVANVHNGQAFAQRRLHHRHLEFLGLLRHLGPEIPQSLEVDFIVDHYSTHKHPNVRACLAGRAGFHRDFIPTYRSWLNQVERWFGLITQRAIRGGSFTSVTVLRRRVESFVENWNHHPRPFIWTATAGSILGKIERLIKVICGTAR
jgi:transposase